MIIGFYLFAILLCKLIVLLLSFDVDLTYCEE